MQGAQKLRSEAYEQVRCNDEVEAQRRRWTFYETINFHQEILEKAEKIFSFPSSLLSGGGNR